MTDDLLNYRDAAAIVGLAASTLRSYRRSGLFPPPDDASVPDRPRWRLSTIKHWQSTRPGQGAPGRPRPRKAVTS